MITKKPLKTQVYDFVHEFKSVPTPMLLSFFGQDYTEGKVKYAISRLKHAAKIYQTEDNERTSINKMYATADMDAHMIDALWVMIHSGPDSIQMYSALKQKEYPKTLIYAIDGVLYEISVLDPMEETLYKSSILRDFENFHSEYSVNVALVYDKESGRKALTDLHFDAYCMLDFRGEGIPTPVFYNDTEL